MMARQLLDIRTAQIHDRRSLASLVKDTHALHEWVAHVFDHPVEDKAWHWSMDAPVWQGSSEQTATFIAECFERSGDLLARFTDAQLNQGFWYLVSNSCSDFMFALVESDVPAAVRLRALRSFVPLFEQVMAVRCTESLDEQPASPLDSACFMWWDILPIHGKPEELDRADFDAAVLRVLQRILLIPNDTCRQSALHGLSEWHQYYRATELIVDEWLAQTPVLHPKLLAYAQCAKIGMVE